MSYCPSCGCDNPDNSAFCRGCGAPLDAQPQQNPTYEPPVYNQQPPVYDSYNTYTPAPTQELPVAARILSIISMVCGIVSCCSCYAGFVFSIAAFITGAISNSKNPMGLENKKVVVGRITAIVGIVISVICLIVYIALVYETMSYEYYDFY